MKKSDPEKVALSRSLVLIGMMGAGKTSVGRALAEMFKVPFVDADTEIETASGCRISRIFAEYGEAEFRRLERKVIERLLDGEPHVLSLGGGAFMDATTRDKIKERSFSIWLRVDKEILLGRLLRHGDRPLLKGSDPREKLSELMEERDPVYALADLNVVCDDRPVAQTARRVYDALHDAETGVI